MRYKTGNRLVLRDDLVIGRSYGGVLFDEVTQKAVNGLEPIIGVDPFGKTYRLRNESIVSDLMIDHLKSHELNMPVAGHAGEKELPNNFKTTEKKADRASEGNADPNNSFVEVPMDMYWKMVNSNKAFKRYLKDINSKPFIERIKYLFTGRMHL